MRVHDGDAVQPSPAAGAAASPELGRGDCSTARLIGHENRFANTRNSHHRLLADWLMGRRETQSANR